MSHTVTHLPTESDERYMRMALDEARLAAEAGDVPVGAVLVAHATAAPTSADIPVILAQGHNTRELLQTALGHAELNVLRDACAALGSWRLADCTLYVTLEPCPMCAGAILQARIARIVCGTSDPSLGAMGSRWSLHCHSLWQDVQIEYGCCEDECRELLKEFFRRRRASGDFDVKS